MRVVPPPLRVTRSPPSSTASRSNRIVEVTGIVTGDAPHANTIVPPAAAAERSTASVQLPGVPSPITVVGDDTSNSGGASHSAVGIVTASTSVGRPSPSLPPPPPPHAAAKASTMTDLGRMTSQDHGNPEIAIHVGDAVQAA